jgi:M6 family metalloprotease-like protein
MKKWVWRFVVLASIFATACTAMNETQSVMGLAISVSFSDTKPEHIHSVKALDDFFNDPDYADNPLNTAANSGSLWSYFHEISNGSFSLKHEVAVYEAPHPSEYYLHKSVSAKRVKELLNEAVVHLRDKEGFDFSKLTLNDEGEIVELAIFYVCNAEPRDDDFIPGYAGGSAMDYGTFKTRRFHIVPQRNFFKLPDGSRPLVLRTFAHEAAHAVLFWPDLYDVDGSSKGLGMASLMSGTGDYNNPLLPTAYLRGKEGWIPVVDITDDPPGTVRKVTGDGEVAYRYSHPTHPEEYFLIDAAHKKSRSDHRFSTTKKPGIPPEGLRIWHVDEKGVNSREAMTPSAHYKVSLVQADGRNDLEKNTNPGDALDSFYKDHATEFNDATSPNARWWDGTQSGLRISNVSAIGPVMEFTSDHRKKPLFVDNARTFKIRQTQGYIKFPNNSYRLTNTTKGDTLEWTAKADVGWLTLSEPSGILAPGESVVLAVGVKGDVPQKKGRSVANISISVTSAKTIFKRRVELVIDPPALVHHWTFDEIDGRTVPDQCRSPAADIKLTQKIAVRNSVEGCMGQGFKVGTRGELSAHMNGWNTGTITLSAWIKVPDGSTGRPQMLLHFPNENAGLLLDREGMLRYTWGKGPRGAAKLDIAPGSWVFSALTIDSGEAVIYVFNSAGEMQRKSFPRRKHQSLELTRFYIGGTSHKNGLQGTVDDVRIHNYPLAESELRKLAFRP